MKAMPGKKIRTNLSSVQKGIGKKPTKIVKPRAGTKHHNQGHKLPAKLPFNF